MSTEEKTIQENVENETETQESNEVKVEIQSTDEENENQSKEKKEPDYLQQLKYAQAELQNYRKRTEKRMAEYHQFSQRNLLLKLLPVLDDFDILFSHNNDDEEHVSLEGVRLIQNKLITLLGELGLKSIESEGQIFDPNHHEAVLTEETSDVEEGTIVKVWQQGYMHHDVLLRPAKVVTAKAKVNEAENAKE